MTDARAQVRITFFSRVAFSLSILAFSGSLMNGPFFVDLLIYLLASSFLLTPPDDQFVRGLLRLPARAAALTCRRFLRAGRLVRASARCCARSSRPGSLPAGVRCRFSPAPLHHFRWGRRPSGPAAPGCSASRRPCSG